MSALLFIGLTAGVGVGLPAALPSEAVRAGPQGGASRSVPAHLLCPVSKAWVSSAIGPYRRPLGGNGNGLKSRLSL